jgi:hypothetical protein
MSQINEAMSKSPFLESDESDFPKLQPIFIPTIAHINYCQLMTNQPVNLPIKRLRKPIRTTALQPPFNSVPSFLYTYKSFCSAFRPTSADNIPEAEAMLASEVHELIAFCNGEVPKHDSLNPRGFCVSLVIPKILSSTDSAIYFIDGIAALSDIKFENGQRLTTKIRFSIYGDLADIPVKKMISKEASDIKIIDGISIVVRWACPNNDTILYKSECTSLGETILCKEDASKVLQMSVVKLSRVHGFDLPPCFFLEPPPSVVEYYEKQFVECSNQFYSLIHGERPFTKSENMILTNSNVLRRVPGCYVRLTPINCGLEGVTSSDAIHAILLCAENMQESAICYAKTYREGLRPPEGPDKSLDLHTVAVQIDRIELKDSISLYAQGGKSGETLKPDGNWLYKTTTSIIPVNVTMTNFYIMSCGLESVLPSNHALLKYMENHIKYLLKFYNSIFNEGISKIKTNFDNTTNLSESLPQHHNKIKQYDQFTLSAIGVDLQSNRMCIGDAISYLMYTNGPKSLIELLTVSSMQVGLGASLQQGFSYCSKQIESSKDTKSNTYTHKENVQNLKRIADASCFFSYNNKKACYNIPTTSPEKVRLLIESLKFSHGNTVRLTNFAETPRCIDDVHRLVSAVYECYEQKLATKKIQFDEISKILREHSDIILAISICISMCMKHDKNKKHAFIILHGYNTNGVSICEIDVSGYISKCGIGRIFELDNACVLMVNIKSKVKCVITPLLYR